MPSSVTVASGIGATLHLFRFAFDLIVAASRPDKKQDKKTENDSKKVNESAHESQATSSNVDDAAAGKTEAVTFFDDQQPYVRMLSQLSLVLNVALTVYFIAGCVMNATDSSSFYGKVVFDAIPLASAGVATFLGVAIQLRDFSRKRFSALQRTLYSMSALILLCSGVFSIFMEGGTVENADIITLIALAVFAMLAILEGRMIPYPQSDNNNGKEEKKARLTRKALMIILKPYFWPDATATSASVNRARAIATWTFVASSKACTLLAPVYIGKASTALASFDYGTCVENVLIYVSLVFGGSLFKEFQSLVYLKVAQAAFVQLSEVSFKHLHSLSLDWHLRKKLGEVIRSMDRGIQACDILMKYLFLWMMPAFAECILVTIIFATYFNYFPLAVSIFFFVFTYIVLTIVITLWRKKFRKEVAKSDNDWHDKCTDSLVNFETVKYFTAENYEMKRFGDAVQNFQKGSVNVQASLSLLNISQQVLLQTCLGVSLILAAYAIKDRIECCVDYGCEEGDFACCSGVSQSTCPGLDIGDFVAVLTYTINLFIPLNFLGTVYNAVVMAMIDLTHLSELLAETPDVTDASDAIELPPSNASDPTVAVEFDNVFFHYPTQSDTSGLKGLSFKMKKGTTTAVVGPTGAGKTTVSRLLFRFYDVLGGAVKINGVDVRAMKQKDVRDAIGVVPQHASMFNDSVGYNIKYGKRDATQEDLDRVAKDAQIDSFIKALPEGWDTLVGDRGLKLSGGEKQRTAIARCLLKDPPIVLLDEATSALDTLTESSVQAALDRLGEERTVLVIAHRLGTIRNADNIIVLKDGNVAEQGTHEELLALNGTYADMWNMQIHSTSDSRGNLLETESNGD
uniref:ABC transporter n=1 Tax=Leptocylindrus danicus TaxID=163516 RepID=A0A7S2LE17_9STRA|mmetsp:Transcript_4471/g.6509  ORF Transcript_4471/g.6509 Transcript_4471/m.6509 type:complete len:855 (+) Transcript_4471:64-2628(+)|eukprot:CAMPEP_0116018002 /NCGR_PEP_ID=MMETSP0321-20121206/8390_1 /TAXON_ID=163516 /ORGANISM="Leptocylindrus danicus var. danicus, Strain B650" /LENGTH=854 /DNA_ID=CAMNT_0003488315 /DNA_START=150 /DNA_END=2714 /DNA_ORIENTATION=+